MCAGGGSLLRLRREGWHSKNGMAWVRDVRGANVQGTVPVAPEEASATGGAGGGHHRSGTEARVSLHPPIALSSNFVLGLIWLPPI